MTPPTGSRPATIDEYLAALEDPARTRLAELRNLVREELPEATEAIKWGSPAFVHSRGTILLVISAHKAHANFTVTPSAKEAFAAELEGLETGKGSVKLPTTRRCRRTCCGEWRTTASPSSSRTA